MAIVQTWRPLKTSRPDGRLLLVKYSFHETEYEIRLTDLSRIWTEHLDRDSVLRKAKENACDIDPGESDQQWWKLCEKLASALNGDETTSVALKTRAVDGTIILDLTSPLPAPLSNIDWRVILPEGSAEEVRDHVSGPLLESVHRKTEELAQLQQIIKDKDHVISRLLDRLESSGTDLTTVFPGTSNLKISRKSSQRSQLSRHVKGLGPFDAADWHPSASHLSRDQVAASFATTVTPDAESFVRRLAEEASDGRDGTAGSASDQPATSANTMRKEARISPAASDTESDNDDFQVQRTPEKPKAVDASTATPAKSATSLRETVRTPAATPAKSKAKIGVLGGKKAERQEVSKASKQPKPTEPAAQPSTDRVTPSPKKAKLGTIGGRKKVEANETSRSQTPQGEVARGRGDSTSAEQQSPVSRGREQSRQDTKTTSSEEPRETSEERANKRRDDLKRQLAAQPSGAAKKKRKF